jgi:transcriptional regulator with XRE-family HTH domain
MARKKGAPGLVEQLREAIRRSGQSLNQLSAACGVGRDRLSRFMRGERDITLGAAEKICLALHLKLTGDKPARPKKADA